MTFDFMRKRLLYLVVSVAVILVGLISLFVPPALRPSIEFTGGSSLDVTFVEPVSIVEVRTVMNEVGHPEAVVQQSGVITGDDSSYTRGFFIRTKTLKGPVLGGDGELVTLGEKARIEEALATRLVSIDSVDFYSISPIVATETVVSAGIAVAVGVLFILAYITWAFRRVSSPFRYGIAAVIALAHDLLIVVGIYSLLTKFFNLEVNTMFIVGVLTILGYSVNDTIVVFDRIRENVGRGVGRTFESTVNISILETLGRSLNTSLTLLIVVVALLVFGGQTIVHLLVVLLIGLVAGTYSSIAVASQILVVWENGGFGKAFRRLRSPLGRR